ncbi:MAG: AarF/UbiB family protein, partial [Croceimicrobium sp.]
MRRLLPLFAGLLMSGMLSAQSYPLVTIQQINQVIDLQACNDSSIYLGDTVRFRAHVVTDGGLSEVASGSVQGGNRPFIYMMDTATNGVVDSLSGIEVMGVYTDAQGALQPIPGFTALFQGDKVEVTAVVEEYQKTIFDELDLVREATNGMAIKHNFAESNALFVPHFYTDYCTQASPSCNASSSTQRSISISTFSSCACSSA